MTRQDETVGLVRAIKPAANVRFRDGWTYYGKGEDVCCFDLTMTDIGGDDWGVYCMAGKEFFTVYPIEQPKPLPRCQAVINARYIWGFND
jgi:hypothetical protein